MGALTFHEDNYPTEHPQSAARMLEVTTFDNAVEIRIGATAEEQAHNQRYAVTLTKNQTAALINDLQRAADYLFDSD